MSPVESPALTWSRARTSFAVCALVILLGAIAFFAAHHPSPAPAIFPSPPNAFLLAGSPAATALEIANSSFDHQHYSAAADAYRRALATRPNNVNARINLATALWQSHQPDDALRELAVALQLDPNDPVALDRLGTIELLEKHDGAAAAAAFQRLLTVAPHYAGKARIGALLPMAGNAK